MTIFNNLLDPLYETSSLGTFEAPVLLRDVSIALVGSV